MPARFHKKSIALIAIYAHPENYPPTLNAISSLSIIYDKVIVLYRGLSTLNWEYPSNVILYADSFNYSSFEQMKLSYFKKMHIFIEFCFRLLGLCSKYSPSLVLTYDPIALYAFSWIRVFKKIEAKKWYHNHDIWRIENAKKYSVSWQAIQNEKKAFLWLDIFSLPALERAVYFPIDKLKGKFIFLPNLPSLSFYNRFKRMKIRPSSQLNLIYQGSLSDEHGFKELITQMSALSDQLGMKINLTLIGPIEKIYKDELINLSISLDVKASFEIKEALPYSQLPYETSMHDIGLAIHTNPKDLNYSTAGTASNKIYEYIALGLPVIYYNSSHYREHLAHYEWAFATDLSNASLLDCLHRILTHYENITSTAFQDFQSNLNFESSFNKIIPLLTNA